MVVKVGRINDEITEGGEVTAPDVAVVYSVEHTDEVVGEGKKTPFALSRKRFSCSWSSCRRFGSFSSLSCLKFSCPSSVTGLSGWSTPSNSTLVCMLVMLVALVSWVAGRLGVIWFRDIIEIQLDTKLEVGSSIITHAEEEGSLAGCSMPQADDFI